MTKRAENSEKSMYSSKNIIFYFQKSAFYGKIRDYLANEKLIVIPKSLFEVA